MIEIGAPKNPIQSALHIGGSKSISNRLLILKAVLDQDLSIANLSDSEDTKTLLQALTQIKHNTGKIIDVHHGGSDMRFLTAFLSITSGEWILTGSKRMKQRPIGELVEALKLLGADITYLEKEHFPPLSIKGKTLKGGNVEIDGSISSQFISALLLIAPAFETGLTLSLKGKPVSRPYIQMTIQLLEYFGLKIEQSLNTIQVSNSKNKTSHVTFDVESDWSSASYWYSICALSKNASIELSSFTKKSLQADSVLPDIYKDLGVKTEFKANRLLLSSIPIIKKELNFNCNDCPDIAQTLALTCLGLGLTCHLTGLSTLKIKETDRLLALKTELEKFGAKVNTGSDYIQIKPEPEILEQTSGKKQETRIDNQVTIETYNDHRMAMSFAPLALITGKIRIKDPTVVTKSYPRFWEDLKSLGFNVNLQP